jgi:(2R)-sulfolactate sulfo-lyase subunit alpha
MRPKFLVHALGDSVGVAAEPIGAGETVEGVVLEDNSSVRARATHDIPLGHKIALLPVGTGAPVTKYGVTIGVATAAIKPGEHVHVHNLKSARW